MLLLAGTPALAGDDFTGLQVDTAFNGGVPVEDRFAGPAAVNYRAQRSARLNNGDLLVVGLVPIAGGVAGRNLGLVRYGQNGQRLAWSAPTPTYASFFNRYLTFPNNGNDNYVRIGGLVVLGDRIYVQLDRAIGGGDVDSSIVGFRDNGEYIGSYGAFFTALREDSAGLVAYSFPVAPGIFARRLIAVATYITGSDRRVVTLKRFLVAADGTLSVDNSFGPFGNGANDIPFPDAACVQLTQCSGVATDVAATLTNTIAPRLYIAAYNRLDGASGLYPALIGINGATGGTLPGFGVGGVFLPPGMPSTMFGAFAPTVAAVNFDFGNKGSFDYIYLLEPYLDGARGNANLQRLSYIPDTGPANLDQAFASSGTYNLGCCIDATAVAADGYESAVAGSVLGAIGGGQFRTDPYVLALDSRARATRSLVDPALRADGGRWGDGGWTDLIPSGNGDGAYLATGTVVDDTVGAPNQQYLSQRYVPRPGDLFANGFE